MLILIKISIFFGYGKLYIDKYSTLGNSEVYTAICENVFWKAFFCVSKYVMVSLLFILRFVSRMLTF